MAKYPELQGAPAKCLNTSPMTINALKIRAPYGSTDVAMVEQPAIVNMGWQEIDGKSAWNLFTSFWQKEDQDAKKGVGWQSGVEMQALDKLKQLANNVIDKKSKYEAQARPKIVSLAKAAKNQLNAIVAEYDVWSAKGFTGKSPYGIQSLSLTRSEKEIQDMLARDEGPIWPAQRREARKKIRTAWDKALRFLWCAVYAANQSKAYLENQKISLEGVVIGAKKVGPVLSAKKVVPKRAVRKVTLVPTSAEPDFVPGMEEEEEEEVVVEEVEEKPKKKKGMGLVIVGAAAVALLAMKR